MTKPSYPLEARFWDQVDVTDTCWLWTGALAAVNHGDGYGHLAYRGKHLNMHRLSWELHNGPIPTGMHVLHRCDVRRCVRPDHLFLGTHAENMRDAAAKARMHLGEADGQAKLTAADVVTIRARHAAGEQYRSIARDFPVTEDNIGMVVRRQTWAHVA